MKSLRTVADFQTSSSSLPSITGGLSNFGIFTGFAFSGGRAIDRFAAPSAGAAGPLAALGLGAGLATAKGGLSIALLRAYIGAQAITKRQRIRPLIRIVLFPNSRRLKPRVIVNYFPVTCGS